MKVTLKKLGIVLQGNPQEIKELLTFFLNEGERNDNTPAAPTENDWILELLHGIAAKDVEDFVYTFHKTPESQSEALKVVEEWKETGLVPPMFLFNVINFLNGTRYSPQYLGRRLKALGVEQIRIGAKRERRYKIELKD